MKEMTVCLSYLKKQMSELGSTTRFPVSISCYFAYMIPNFPGKKFAFPWEVVFFPSPDFEGMSTATYLIWKPPAVTEESDRNFKVITLPGQEKGKGGHPDLRRKITWICKISRKPHGFLGDTGVRLYHECAASIFQILLLLAFTSWTSDHAWNGTSFI